MSAQAAAPTLKLLTVNVNGLGGARAPRLFCYQQQVAGNPDVTFVQEAKLGSKEALQSVLHRGSGPGAPWRGTWGYSPGSNHSCGVAILARPRVALPGCMQHPPATGTDGRVCCWDWDILHLRLRLLCVYAPAMTAGRAAFFQSLQPYLDTDRHIILGGDLNCVMEARDEAQPSQHRAVGQQVLQALASGADLVDPWPAHGVDKGFTHPASPHRPPVARLDRWLISRPLQQFVKATRVVPGAPGDHLGVLLELALPGLPTLGRSGWSFPSYLLYHPSLLPRLKSAVEQEIHTLQQQDSAADPRDVWESLKGRLRGVADRLHRQHIKDQAADLRVAKQAACAALAALHQAAPGSPAGPLAAQACSQLARAVQQAACRRSAALDAAYTQHGDKGTGWFHQLGREARSREPVTHLTVPGQPHPVSLSTPNASATISAAAHAMYSSDSPTGLFRVEEVDTAAQDQILQHLRRRLPPQLREAADSAPTSGQLQLEEIAAALSSCLNGTAPGSDGLPYEVYRILWPLLGPLLLAAANVAFMQGSVESGAAAADSLPLSWREGVISLIYKGKDLPRPHLSSYRPITLLQCDYKLVCKAISNRLQPALDYLVDPLQTAFISGRDIRDNILYHLALAEWVRHSEQPAALLMLDVEKAYDRVHRPWLYRVTEAMGFGPHMQRWLRLLTSDGSSCVVVNGHLSSPFPVRNGLQQGSTLSPVLWVLQLEPLTSYLHHLVSTGRLHTPSLPNGLPAPPVTHHADDTVLTVSDVDVDGPVAKAAVQLFCQASNARENASKGKGMVLGTHPLVVGTNAATGAKFPAPGDGPPRHLGIPLTLDPTEAANLCYSSRIQRIQRLGHVWRRHGLSLVGRVHVAKQVLGNTLAYHFSVIRPSPPQLAALRKHIDGFAAWSFLAEDATLVCHGRALLKPDPVIACQDRDVGGIGHIDLDAFLTALHAKTLAQLAQPGQQPWKQLMRGLLTIWAPVGTAGWGWVYGTAAPRPDLPPYLASLVLSFRSSLPARLPYPEATDLRALLHEPLFFNPALRDPATSQPFSPLDAAPHLGPRTLAELRAASATTQHEPLMQAVLGALPPDWKRLLPADPLDPDIPPTPTWLASPDGLWVRSPAGVLWSVLTNGRLVPPDSVQTSPAVSADWPAACVLLGRKPRRHWTLEERQTYSEAPPAQRPSLWPVEHQLLGPWESVQCYPLSHGHGALSLIHYTVCEVRHRLTAQRHSWGLSAATGPLIPAAWPTLPSSRLQQQEAVWLRQWQDQRGPSHSRWFTLHPVVSPSWLQPRSGSLSPPSTSPSTASQPRGRLSNARQPGLGATPGPSPPAHPALGAPASPPPGGAGPSTGPPDPPAGLTPLDCQRTWQRLWACPAGNRAKALVWRLQHARLPCGLYLASKGRPQRAHCPAPSCNSDSQPCPATLTHIFVVCPSYAGARAWLADLWVAVTGATAPPLSQPALLMGDWPGAWPAYPTSPGLQALWTALRATWLWAVWCHYHAAEPDEHPSATVVSCIVGELQRLMWAHFRMAALPDETLAGLPCSLITAQLQPTRLEAFEASWAHEGVLCSVLRAEGSAPRLQVHLSLAAPVPAPQAVAPGLPSAQLASPSAAAQPTQPESPAASEQQDPLSAQPAEQPGHL